MIINHLILSYGGHLSLLIDSLGVICSQFLWVSSKLGLADSVTLTTPTPSMVVTLSQWLSRPRKILIARNGGTSRSEDCFQVHSCKGGEKRPPTQCQARPSIAKPQTRPCCFCHPGIPTNLLPVPPFQILLPKVIAGNDITRWKPNHVIGG